MKKTKWKIVSISGKMHERTIQYQDRIFKTSHNYPYIIVEELVIRGNNKHVFTSGKFQYFYKALGNFKEMVEHGYI